MKLTVDRIVEGIAVLEKDDLSHIEISVSLLPDGVKEGSILSFDGTTYSFDAESETEVRARIAAKQRSIFKKR